MHYWTRRIFAGVIVVAVVYTATCAYLWSRQRDLVFEPTHLMQTTPDRLGMKFEEVSIPVGSGENQGELDGWWIPAEQASVPTLLFLHGNDKNISHGHDIDNALRLHSLGYNLLMIDYRGYGKSSGGKPSEAKVYEDAEAAWQYLLKVRGVKPKQAFIYGHSLGGAIGIDLAVHHPEAAGLVVESTFTSMTDMGKLEYPLLPVDLLLDQRFEVMKKIPQLKIPVLLIHGTRDKLVPVRMAQQLYAVAPQPKMLMLIDGGGHSNSGTIGWLEYSEALSSFVKQYAH